MKKNACLVLLFAFILMLVGCFDSEQTPAPAWYLVKQTTTEKNGTETVTTFEYDAQGRLVKYEIRTGNAADTVKNVEYDKNGYKNYEKGVSETGLETEIFWKNDRDGRPTEQKLVTTYKGNSTESLSVFEYTDAYGSYVQRFVSGASTGNTITVTKDEHGNEVTHEESNSTSVRYENTYDGEKLTQRTCVRLTPSGSVFSKIWYEYDENGNLTKEITYDAQETVVLTRHYEYEWKE